MTPYGSVKVAGVGGTAVSGIRVAVQSQGPEALTAR